MYCTTKPFVTFFVQTTICNRIGRRRNIIFQLLILFFFLSTTAFAQVIKTFDFATPTSYNAVSKGYDKLTIGTYFKAATGGTISFGTTTCFGYSISAPTGSNIFIFRADDAVNSITINGTGTGSNRTLTAFATSTTIAGTFNNFTFSTSGIINSGTCGSIICTPQTAIPAGTFMKFTFSGNLNITSIDLDIVPTGTPPTITTNSVLPAQNFATINATLTPGTMPLMASGIIWSPNNTPLDTTLTTRTRNVPAANGIYNNTATGLIPAQTYYARAYVIDMAKNVYYGQTIQFTTNPATLPTLTTINPYNIFPYKASSGGNNIDSGGVTISDKGLCWSTTSNPTIASNKISNGANGINFTNTIRILQPATTYYIRAYAINTVGVGYGNEIQFTTASPAPYLLANPLSLNFGNIAYGSAASILNYKINGYNLSPASGNITINAPVGYTLSSSINGVFSNPLSVSYSSGSIVNKTIYVKMTTVTYGSLSGSISHTGGGLILNTADSVNVSGVVIPDPNVTTNAGTDFWTGFGYQEKMNAKAGDAAETKLSIYISVPLGSPAALINVDLPGIVGAIGFPKQGLSITPGSVIEISDFPTGDASNNLNPGGFPDSRLYYTGISKRGIHIYSTNGVPVSVWMHTYNQGNSAAGAMLFPTNTWNNAYTVLAYGGQTNSVYPRGGYTNNSNPNSFFFVVANEDNTPIWFTPSQDILDSSAASIFTEGHTATNVKYPKNVEYGPIYLNKGQVFNAMGFIQGSGSSANGLDLSGSKVRTECSKKIAVFGGNGRCLVNAGTCTATSGSDHMIQQMFPSVAWGNKYITVPTKTMEYNIFRINITDPATNVWVNNPGHTTPLTGLINNLYYQIEGSTPNLIESDKPISVTQFLVAGDCNNSKGFAGAGDPEMIILSPVQQAINNVTVYSANIKKSTASVNGHYINVIIRKAGIATFKLDGISTCDTGRSQIGASATNCYDASGTISIANAFQKHPNDTNYYYAKFKVTPGAAHSLYSDSDFVAMAYGMGDGESYGYNAGTNIKDLTKPLFIDNPYLPNSTSNTSCTNNSIFLKAVLPYAPSQITSIKWSMSLIQGVVPQTDFTINNPTADSTFIKDGVTYYVYKNPTSYIFTSAGSYNITGLIAGTFASQCGSTTPISFNINISDPGFADFSFQYNPCTSNAVQFTDQSNGNGFNIVKWQWNFGDNTTDTIHQNPSKIYASNNIYTVKLRAINSIGCYADTIKVVDLTSVLTAKFGVRDTICVGSNVVFSDSSSNTGLGGNIIKWSWDFGDGSPIIVSTTAVNQTHTYLTAGNFTVVLKVETSGGCFAIYSKQIEIRPNPMVNFTAPVAICLPGSASFINTTTISDTTINTLSYVWNFGDGSANSSVIHPVHTFPNTTPPASGYTVVLTATSKYGCVANKSVTLNNIFTKPVAAIIAPLKACLGDSVQFNDNSSGISQNIIKWYWTFGDNGTDTIKNPKHKYLIVGTYQIRLVVQSDKGCNSDTSAPVTIKINPLPNADFLLPSSCLSSGSVTFNNTSTISPNDATQFPFTYQWNFGDPASGILNSSTQQNGQHSYTAAGNYLVSLITTSAQGCSSSTTTHPFVINGTRPTAIMSVVTNNLCSNDSIRIVNASTIAIGTITKIEITWDTVGNPNVIEIDNAPFAGKIYAHKFPTFQTLPLTKQYVIRFRAFSGTTCLHDTTKLIIINAAPKTTFGNEVAICSNASPRILAAGSETSGIAGSYYYYGLGVTGTNVFNPTLSNVGTQPLTYVFTSAAGCKDSSTSNIVVWPIPQAKFGVSTPVCEGNTITFSDSSVAGAGAITQWNWLMGDGSPVMIKYNNSPFTYTYNNASSYTIDLSIKTSNGCISNAGVGSQTIVVSPKPIVDFIMPSAVCMPNGGGIFKDASTIANGTAASFQYNWLFSDGITHNTKDVNHIFSSIGSYTVKLIVSSGAGCIDSTSKTFNNIFPQPKAAFTIFPNSKQVCLGDAFTFTDNSNGMGAAVNSWNWQYSDNSIGANQSMVSKQFSNATNYIINHWVYNSNGCVSDTVSETVSVEAFPVVNGGNINYVLLGNSIVLNPQVSGSNASTTYLWNTATYLNSDIIQNPTCTPLNDIGYLLKVTNGAGCTAQDSVIVRLYRSPIIPNAFSPNGDGIHDRWDIGYMELYPQALIEVFNRNGQTVYKSNGSYSPWDGKMNGNSLPVGTYYYIIRLGIIPTPISGYVVILR